MKRNLKPITVYFREEQKYSQSPRMWILILTFLITTIPFLFGLYQQLVLGKPWGDQSMSDNNLILTTIFMIVLMGSLVFFFARMKLQVMIDENGIHYRFPFFIIKEVLIPRDKIERYEVRKFKPLVEYGGWGYKQGIHRKFKRLSKKGAALTIKGTIGLQLYFKDGKKLLIGTQRAEAIRRAMDKMMKEETERNNG